MSVVPIQEKPSASLEVKRLDHLGVLSDLWEELGFSEVVDASVPVDDQVKLRPSTGIKGLVLNLISGRNALYRVENFFEGIAMSAVLGEGVVPSDFNDTALSRLLDRFFEAGPDKLYSALSMRAIAREDLECDRVHADTTSKLVFGRYETVDPDAISITYGHSKDHRPDLKQVMFGLATNKSGVPLVGQMLDGNQSDKPWHGGLLEVIQNRLSLPEGAPLEYVGDSALITRENLSVAQRKGVILTGRLPRTVRACQDAVEQAFCQPDCWQDIGAVSERRHAVKYQAQWFGTQVLGTKAILAVYRSDGPNERAEQSVRRRLQREKKALESQKKDLEKKAFACEADAQMELSAFQGSMGSKLLTVTGGVERREVSMRFPTPGRPKRDASRPVVHRYHISLEISENAQAIEESIRKKSCFVLIHTGRSIESPKVLLSNYKDQIVTETRFPFLKDAAMADVFFVKYPRRVESLGWIMLIALLLWCLWERRIRMNHRASGEGPLIDTPGNKVQNPTAFVCRHILNGLLLMRPSGNPSCPWHRIAPLKEQQARVIRFSQRSTPRTLHTG